MSIEWFDLDEFIREEITKDFDKEVKLQEIYPNIVETNCTVDFNDLQQVRRVQAMLLGKTLDNI